MACGERLLKKLAQTERALDKLEQVKDLKEKLEEEILYEVCIKRFESTFETLWKTVRPFLLEQKGLECNSPIDCFKSFYSVGMLEKGFGDNIPRVVRLRKEVVHIYDFSLAEKAYTSIMETALPLFRAVHMKIREECQKED